ncbi:MAG: ribonuclease G [Pseudomonadota bacterium]
MREEILINITPQETRVAMLENGMLQEVHIERVKSKGIVGNIYLGKVVRVLPGMQAAFVEIGLERTAFLHARDLVTQHDAEGIVLQQMDQDIQINSLVTEGQNILVQVVKDPMGSKGARLTGQISIPSRNLVYLPNSDYVGISQRIQDEDSRETLLTQINELRSSRCINGGFIVRTAGEKATVEEIRADLEFLLRLWQRVKQREKSQLAPSIVHEDLPLAMRMVRDLTWQNVEKIRIDSRETFDMVSNFARELMPDTFERIEHYPGERPIFDLYAVEDEIQKALQTKVPLKSGGYLIIDQTEAMTTVDINTGSFVGKRNLEETIFKTNLEAASALARQLRVRNIGGIIIIDFIDMAVEDHVKQVMRTLERELEKDKTKTQVSAMSSLGLVEVTRKRTSESLERLLTEPCPSCAGRGTQKTPETTCYEIFREIIREAREFDTEKYLVIASQPVIDLLLDEESTGLADLQDFINKSIHLQVEPTFTQEQFDVVLM